MKCVDCGTEFKEEKKERLLKIVWKNLEKKPTEFKGICSECPKCHAKYTSEEDMDQLIASFEKAETKE